MQPRRQLVASLLALSIAGAEVILPSDVRLRYIGRVSHEGEVTRYGWAGTQIVTSFQGSTISANLSGSAPADRYVPVIDGSPGTPFTTGKGAGWEMHVLADGLPDATHTLSLWKVSEDLGGNDTTGVAALGGFSAAGFLEPPAPAARRLEFIGDSDTAGWCADGLYNWTGNLTDEGHVENTHETWASQISRAFGADMVQQAISGIGVTAGRDIKPLLNNVLPFSSASTWNYSIWVPDAVVMLIGPNDPNPNNQTFIDSYRELMEMVAKNYAGAATKPPIIHVCGGSINGLDPCQSIQVANDQFNVNRTDGFRGYYTTISDTHWHLINSVEGQALGLQGCHHHYSPRGHDMLAGDIIPQLAKIMGWTNVDEEVFV